MDNPLLSIQTQNYSQHYTNKDAAMRSENPLFGIAAAAAAGPLGGGATIPLQHRAIGHFVGTDTAAQHNGGRENSGADAGALMAATIAPSAEALSRVRRFLGFGGGVGDVGAEADSGDKGGFTAPEIELNRLTTGLRGRSAFLAPSAAGSGLPATGTSNIIIDFLTPLLGVTQSMGIYFCMDVAYGIHRKC